MDFMPSITSQPKHGISRDSTPMKSFVEDEETAFETIEPPRVRPMYYAAFACLLMATAMGLATGYSAPATYDMEFRANSRLKPNDFEITWIGSMLALGAMLAGVFSGPLADAVGRKDILIYNIVPFAVGWLTICYAPSVPAVMIGRFFCGIACGVVSVTVPMYCVEISTAEVRGILGSAFQGFLVIGSLLSVIVGSYVTWEVLAIVGVVFATTALVCFIPMPESPRWLLAKGQLENAISVVDKLQRGYIDAEKECNGIFKDLEEQPKGRLSLKECKHPTVYKPALISFALMFFQQFCGANAVLFYSSQIFEVAKNFMEPKKSTIVLGAFQVVATLLGNLIVDKAGRKILLILSGTLMALSLAALGTYYYFSSKNLSFQNNYNWLPLLSLVIFVNAFSIGFGSIPWLLASEMVPVRARSSVSGLATFANGLFAFIVTKTFSEIKDLIGPYGTFWFYGSISMAGALFVFFVVPETKGKQLEEIESIFDKSIKKQTKQVVTISVITK